jgi:DNA-binding beta-propeller fold protein YncE
MLTATETGSGGVPGDDNGEEKLDVRAPGETDGAGDCMGPGMMGGEAFSVIWIANSPEGTVSKIDTATREELGRFWSGPDEGGDDPSRTSVNLRGNVAVTNRSGSITKIAAADADCVDANGDGMITTSQGPMDVLAWGEDECVLWHQDLPHDDDNRHGPRPTAWDADENDPCDDDNARVWVGWYDHPGNAGYFRHLEGNTGSTIQEAMEPNWDASDDQNDYGPYGGAVDRDGDFWVSGRSPGPLIEIDHVMYTIRRFEVPDGTEPYGIAMDANGHPWMAGTDGSMLHFDPDAEAFDVIPVANVLRGVMVDANGFAWGAANEPCGAVQVDTTTLMVINAAIALPGCVDPVGVSIDSDGYVWLPDREANLAFKVDPITYTAATTITPLTEPYTYSDMTGFGLGLVTTPPAG